MSIFPGHLYAGGQIAPATPGATPPQRRTVQAVASNGAQLAATGPTNLLAWQVYRVTVQGNAAGGGSVGPAYIRVDGVVIEGTSNGAFDTDDTIHPIFVPPGSTIDVIWPELTGAGDTASAVFEYLPMGG